MPHRRVGLVLQREPRFLKALLDEHKQRIIHLTHVPNVSFKLCMCCTWLKTVMIGIHLSVFQLSWWQTAPLIHVCLPFFNLPQVLIWLIQTLLVGSLSTLPCTMPVTDRMFCCVKTDPHFLSVRHRILKSSHNKSLSKVLVWITQRWFWLIPAGSWRFKHKEKKKTEGRQEEGVGI